MKPSYHDVAVIGAGPIGLEMTVALKKAGIDYILFDKGQVGQTITWFPRLMKFFSSPERIAIAGVPIPRTDESKCSREEFLAYLRSVALQFDLKINTYENVTSVIREDDDFLIHTDKRGEKHDYRAKSVIIANGSTDTPRLLDIPGEQLPHVTHYFEEPHKYFKQRVLVVGGRNSAVEAALRCYHCGADVILSHRRSEFDPDSIKYWLLPEIRGLAERGELPIYQNTVPKEIRSQSVTLERVESGDTFDVDADFVLLMVGYRADMTLFTTAGVSLEGPQDKPVFDERTMETNVPSLYVAGTAIAGSQQTYNVFMENCHIHVERIMAALTGTRIDDNLIKYDHPES